MTDADAIPVLVPTSGDVLHGDLGVADGAKGLVLFAHGSGSGRRSPRNLRVAAALRVAGFSTLRVDLFTPTEREDDAWTHRLRFDVGLLARRLGDALAWAASEESVAHLPIGLFGASTGAAAALFVAAARPHDVRAVVSRGGRLDLAASALPRVLAPTRLVVGARDEQVLALTETAYARLRCRKDLVVVPNAGHLFEEPGALERVAAVTVDWFVRRLAPSATPETAAS